MPELSTEKIISITTAIIIPVIIGVMICAPRLREKSSSISIEKLQLDFPGAYDFEKSYYMDKQKGKLLCWLYALQGMIKYKYKIYKTIPELYYLIFGKKLNFGEGEATNSDKFMEYANKTFKKLNLPGQLRYGFIRSDKCFAKFFEKYGAFSCRCCYNSNKHMVLVTYADEKTLTIENCGISYKIEIKEYMKHFLEDNCKFSVMVHVIEQQ